MNNRTWCKCRECTDRHGCSSCVVCNICMEDTGCVGGMEETHGHELTQTVVNPGRGLTNIERILIFSGLQTKHAFNTSINVVASNIADAIMDNQVINIYEIMDTYSYLRGSRYDIFFKTICSKLPNKWRKELANELDSYKYVEQIPEEEIDRIISIINSHIM